MPTTRKTSAVQGSPPTGSLSQTRAGATAEAVVPSKQPAPLRSTDGWLAVDGADGNRRLQECLPRHLADFASTMRHVQVPEHLSLAGLATATYVLNSMGGRALPLLPQYEKGGYEYASQDWLRGTTPALTLAPWGMSLARLGDVLAENGVDAKTRHLDAPLSQSAVREVRRDLIAALENPSQRVIVNWESPTGETGRRGRIGPVLAYHQKTDSFLVYELQSGAAAPLWVPTEQLCQAMATRDDSAHAQRGYAVASQRPGAAAGPDHTAPVPDALRKAVVYFDSPEGTRLLRSARPEHMRDLGRYLGDAQIQDDVFSCGRASVAMQLSALGLPTSQDDVLRLLPPDKTAQMTSGRGLSLADLADAARARGARARVVEATAADGAEGLEAFRRAAVEALADPHGTVMANFDRKTLGQTGTGHHSPLAGYDQKSDMFLVRDVAAFKTDSFWVSAEQLYRACQVEDADFRSPRGLLVVSAPP